MITNVQTGNRVRVNVSLVALYECRSRRERKSQMATRELMRQNMPAYKRGLFDEIIAKLDSGTLQLHEIEALRR
jgi:anti-sigma factor ChrR (cupin superfamily)